ncbi:hypothetical protein U8527_04920 [Kordia algicida OT-1]|uniref:Uncharacterized protein n=1 Tax=Kordia algicida OT-1 TaxID=391587 RepID=A9DMA6_9FLAO|nr:hypothetical protein [Kordia algicida]EDP97663.1 hypothetical protein KAOT1_20912 [Kordia algicida OT-1]
MKEKSKPQENPSIITVMAFVVTLLLLIQKDYFTYYKARAVILILILTSFTAILSIEIIIIPFVIASCLFGYLEIVDRILWKSPLFSWMFTVEDFSGTYEGTQENIILKEVERDDENKKIYREYREHLQLKIIIHQTGSDIKANFFYYNTNDGKSSKSEDAQVSVTKTADGCHYILTCLHGDIGILENGGHHETVVLKYIKQGSGYCLEGGYYDNRKFHARGMFIGLKKVSSEVRHPF